MARYQGRLIEWHDEQGYGFIQGISDPKHQRVFLHISAFERSGPRPIEGCVLEYELGIDDQSRPQARNVRYVKAKQVFSHNPNSQPFSSASKKRFAWHPMYLAMLVYWVVLFVTAAYGQLPPFTLLVIMLVNSYCYWIFYQDKKAAMQGDQRISEQHLLLMCALGGWTAAWFAMKHFHHKTQKQPFKKYYYLSIVAHIALLAFSVFMLRLF